MDLKRINTLRRKLMRRLTKNVGASQFDQNIDLTKVKFNKILICRPNPRLETINHSPITRGHFPPECEIDLFVNGGLAPPYLKIIQT
jgi:hypothetical protein